MSGSETPPGSCLSEAVVYEFAEIGECLLFIATVHLQCELRSQWTGKHEEPHDALSIHLLSVFFDPHFRRICRRLLNELRRGPCVEAEPVSDRKDPFPFSSIRLSHVEHIRREINVFFAVIGDKTCKLREGPPQSVGDAFD